MGNKQGAWKARNSLSFLAVSGFFSALMAMSPAALGEQDIALTAAGAEMLAQGTNNDRREIMLQLCIRLDAGRRPGRLDRLVRSVIPLLEDPDHVTRHLAAEILSRVGKEARPAIPALIRALGDRESCAGFAAVIALERLGEAAVPALIGALNQQDVIVRELAATTLGRLGPIARPALPALIKARTAAKEEVVRERVSSAIERITKGD
jgi:hypothetical protein